MIYFSQILNRTVLDSADARVGRLVDILIQHTPGEYAPLLFLVVERKPKKELYYIPYEYVANVSKQEIALKNVIAHIPHQQPVGVFTYLKTDILDEQIVDLEGVRVVRVNDLTLGVFEDAVCVLGIDVSFKGILRRLQLTGFDLFNFLQVTLIDWRKAQLVKGALKLDTISHDLKRLHPADLANIIEDLSLKQGSNLVDSLDSAAAAQVIEEMDPEIQKMIIHYLGPERAGDIVQKMSVDETVDLLHMLPKTEAKKFLAYLQESKYKKVERLITYPDDTAGGLMTTDYVEANPDWTVARVIEEVKHLSASLRSILYVYVTEADDTLIGTVSLRSLLVAKPTETMREILKKVPEASILRAHQKVKEVVQVMTKYNLYSAAVLGEKQIMVGVVTVDDVMRHLFPKA